MIFIMMGVTGSGKTTIGRLLAARIDAEFADADDFHSAANKAKMASGTPLTDEDREPWLLAIHRYLQGWVRDGVRGVLACSALKEAYRATLVKDLPPDAVRFVVLEGSRELFAGRLQDRHEHFMNPKLLDSQIATLEDPGDEAFHVANDGTPDQTVDAIVSHFGSSLAEQPQKAKA